MNINLEKCINIIQTMISIIDNNRSVLMYHRKESLFLRDKPSNLQKLTNWVNEEASEKANKNAENKWSRNNENHDDDSKLDHRNQHQKASSGSLSSSPYVSSEENDPSLVVDLREKTESVAWVIQMPPSPNTSHFDKRRKRN